MRKLLKITTTATCLAACLALVALWVRSYWQSDSAETGFDHSVNWIVQSFRGQIVVKYVNHPNQVWNWQTTSWENTGIYLTQTLSRSWDVPTVLGVGARREFDGVIFALRYWHLTGFSLALSAAPWLPWRRFTVRTLLIAMAIVAAILGLAVATN